MGPGCSEDEPRLIKYKILDSIGCCPPYMVRCECVLVEMRHAGSSYSMDCCPRCMVDTRSLHGHMVGSEWVLVELRKR
eukprot:1137094-Pelagomonas_calceolata.AAC.2